MTSHPFTSRLLRGTPVTSIADAGAGDALVDARAVTPDVLIDLLADTGLRGRGGAGFPTAVKWRTVRAYASSAQPTPVVVNAAEGEPGTYKDRTILQENPYLVLEGALIAAHTMGSADVYIGTKASFTHELARLRAAIAEITAAGWTDGVTIRVVEGPGSYLYGEETGLLEVMEDRPPFPRVTPPFRRGVDPAHRRTGHSASGAAIAEEGGAGWFAPALATNVETMANLPGIVRNGAEWFRSIGTAKSPGTIVCTVTGSTKRHGVGEFAMGTSLREVIDALGGGLVEGRRIAVVLCGASGSPIPPALLDLPLTYEDFAAEGMGLGSGSFMVVDDHVALPRLAQSMAHFLGIESCGQCEPCKRDGLALDALLAAPQWDDRAIDSRLATVNRGARCALAGQTERVVGELVALARRQPGGTEWDDHVNAVVPLVEIVEGRAVLDVGSIRKRADWSYPDDGPESNQWPAQHLADTTVVLRRAHTPEPADAADGAEGDDGVDHAFDGLLASHREIEEHLAALRSATAADRPAALAHVRHDLDAHLRVTQRFLFPMADRVRPDDGDDIVEFPERHERNALRLLNRLDHDPESATPQLLDDLAADVRTSIIEIERRVLPMLQARLDPEQEDELRDGILSELES